MNLAVFHQVFRNFQLNTFNGLNFIVENINSCSDDLNGADTDNRFAHRRVHGHSLAAASAARASSSRRSPGRCQTWPSTAA